MELLRNERRIEKKGKENRGTREHFQQLPRIVPDNSEKRIPRAVSVSPRRGGGGTPPPRGSCWWLDVLTSNARKRGRNGRERGTRPTNPRNLTIPRT